METAIKKYSINDILEASIYDEHQEEPATLYCTSCSKVLAKGGKAVHGRKYFWYDHEWDWYLCKKDCADA